MSNYNNSNKDGSDLTSQKPSQNQKDMKADPKKSSPAYNDPKEKSTQLQDEDFRKQNKGLSSDEAKERIEDRSAKAPLVEEATDGRESTANRSQFEHGAPKKL